MREGCGKYLDLVLNLFLVLFATEFSKSENFIKEKQKKNGSNNFTKSPV